MFHQLLYTQRAQAIMLDVLYIDDPVRNPYKCPCRRIRIGPGLRDHRREIPKAYAFQLCRDRIHNRKPMPLEHAATPGRGSLLQLSRCTVGTQIHFKRVHFRFAKAVWPQ